MTRAVNWYGRKPKLTPEQVAELRQWAVYGTNRTEVARRLGVSTQTLRCYLRGEHKRRYGSA